MHTTNEDVSVQSALLAIAPRMLWRKCGEGATIVQTATPAAAHRLSLLASVAARASAPPAKGKRILFNSLRGQLLAMRMGLRILVAESLDP